MNEFFLKLCSCVNLFTYNHDSVRIKLCSYVFSMLEQ